MTTRLKRRLADMGVDASSSKANESFCLIGTPLPPLEKSKDTGEFVPLWKQDVRDDKGRRRLHGAFTGGFSAGYFNTVGSKEGWTPSTFVSSRNDRNKAKQAKPEDFMDDEDMAELAEDRKLVDTTDELDLTSGTSDPSGANDDDDSMARKLEAALLPPPSDSVGAKILKQMGWRIGQGIGPRLTFRQKQLQDSAFGVAGDPDVDNDEMSEESKHTYAPRDTPLLLPSRKADVQGLGYQPGTSLHHKSAQGGDSTKGPTISAGFGLGALNDADDDDVDVYDSGLSRGKTRMAYDSMDVDDREDIVIGGSRRRGDGRLVIQAKTTPGQTFRDGRPVLAGFMVAHQPLIEDKWYALPDPPKEWKPNPRKVWNQDAATEPASLPKSSQPDKKTYQEWKKGVTADERGATLGEAPLPTAPRSVFDYMSQKDRERLQRAAAGAGGPSSSTGSSSSTSMPPPIAQPATIDIPRIEPFIAKAALMGFQPFIKDPVKHERYTIYLKSQSTVDGSAPSLTPYPGQSIDAFNKEVSDFSKSATVFKPLSGAMAGRFTSAAVVESGATAQEGLYQPKFDPAEEAKSKEAEKEKKTEPEVDLDPSTNAARLDMYGPMTRTVTRWAPARLLCKRLGVKDPHPEPDAEDVPAPPSAFTSTSTAQEPIAAIMPTDSTTDGEVPAYPTTDDIKAPSGPRDLSNIGLGDDEYQAQDVLTYQRPSMDVFKAIFASDDEDSDDEDAPVNVKTAIAGPTVAPEQDISSSTIPSAATVIPSIAAQPGPATLITPSALGQILETTSLDLSTFRPTFVSRSDRSQAQKADDASKSRKKKRTNALVSFDDEDGEGSGLGVPKVKKRKEKHKNKEKDGDKKHKTKLDQVDVEDEWVEKPVAEVVKNMSLSSEAGGPATQIKGRKTAVDFM